MKEDVRRGHETAVHPSSHGTLSPKHTRGPWVVEDPMGPDILSIVADGHREVYNWRHIAQVSCDEDNDSESSDIHKTEMEANARLIAAAPDLLEALMDAYVQLGSLHAFAGCIRDALLTGGKIKHVDLDSLDDAWMAINAAQRAIKKATGAAP